MRTIRIGSGAGFGGDRIEPALAVMEHGQIDSIIFECLAERTIALAQQHKATQPEKGYNELLEYRMTPVLPLCVEKQIKVITNMGAANPVAAARTVKHLARELGIKRVKIAAVLGDDIFPQIERYLESPTIETGEKLAVFRSAIVSANAYIGAEGIVQALQHEADIVITGRVADPSLVLGPLRFAFGWAADHYEVLGKGTLAGHLLECGAQVTGGYYADPAYKDVPDLWNVGFPIAEIFDNGDLTITKLAEAGGMVTPATVKEQIVYEIHDPCSYLTPDVIADFSQVAVQEVAPNTVFVTGASGKAPNGMYKTSIGYRDGFLVEGEISYGGSGAYERAQLAGEVIAKRVACQHLPVQELRIDYIGVNSLYKDAISNALHGKRPDFKEVRLRVAGRTAKREDARRLGNEVEALYTNGPAGGGGVRVHVTENIAITSILVPRDAIRLDIIYEEI